MSLVISPITNHANRDHSHRTGWGRMWAASLDSELGFNKDWTKEDKVYLEHGMEFNVKSKGVNVFLKEPKSWDKLAEKAEMLCNFKGELYSLDIECPDYGERLKSRVRPHSTDSYTNLDFDKITSVCKKAKTIKQKDLTKKGLVLGDSHSLSAWRKDAYLCRNDGQTLNGAINKGFDLWIDDFQKSSLSFIRTYFGNIDIRHHICRISTGEKEQLSTISDLVSRYFNELNRVKEKYCLDLIEVVAVLPIENISRKLPKTGYYKGKPYWGSWEERNRAHVYFNEECEKLCLKNGFSFIKWPKSFYNEKLEMGFENMEKPRSVHVSPRKYMWEAFSD